MKVKFTIEKGNIDKFGSKILISGVKIPPKKILVFLDFNIQVENTIGLADVFIENSEIVAEMDLDEKYLDSMPAIAYKEISLKIVDGIKIVEKSEIINIGLSFDHSNDDNSILSIREQIKDETTK